VGTGDALDQAACHAERVDGVGVTLVDPHWAVDCVELKIPLASGQDKVVRGPARTRPDLYPFRLGALPTESRSRPMDIAHRLLKVATTALPEMEGCSTRGLPGQL
jgi:hypothetical protein